MAGIINRNIMTQVGFIVKDVEATKAAFAEFMGVEVPPTVNGGEFEITQTEYKGNKVPKSNCKMAFFNVNEGFQLELIEPNGEPSTWQEFLDTKGEGMHHIAFGVDGMQKNIMACEGFGLQLVQKGEYGDASGRYAYLDATDKLKTIIELLESDNK